MPCFDLWGWWIRDTEGTLIWTAKQSVDVEIIQVHSDRMRSTKDDSAIEVKQSCHLVMDFTIGMYCNMRHADTFNSEFSLCFPSRLHFVEQLFRRRRGEHSGPELANVAWQLCDQVKPWEPVGNPSWPVCRYGRWHSFGWHSVCCLLANASKCCTSFTCKTIAMMEEWRPLRALIGGPRANRTPDTSCFHG